jgi:predicted RNA binding protein YcfA (HicA-like mRNA interferase family)
VGSRPALKPQEVVAIPQRPGLVEVRQRGSHKPFRDDRGRCTTVPCRQGRDISPILLRQISKDIGISLDDLASYR